MSLGFLSSLLGATGQPIDPSFFNNDFFMGIWSSIGNTLGLIFNLVCSIIYFPVKWLLAFTDFLQYFIQKLIGLDYWLNNNVYTFSGAANSDVLFSFLYSDTVQRVFTTMSVVFIVLLIIFTIYAIIRSEWQYITGEKFGDGSNSKMGILRNSMKAIALVLIFPLTITLGIISSNAILASLVRALNIDMASTFGGSLFLIGSKNGNKYRTYAKSGQRAPITDYIEFYVKDGKVVRLGSTDYVDDYVMQYKDFDKYLQLIQGTGATRYRVNSIFEYNKFDTAFSGYIIGMDVEDQRYYYPVKCNMEEAQDDVSPINSPEAMYYYLRDILQVDIMCTGNYFDDGDGYEIYKAIGAGNFSPNANTKGLIRNKNFDGETNEAVWRAIYNTWGYASIYEKTHEFETSLGYYVTSMANEDLSVTGTDGTGTAQVSLLSLLGLNFVNAKILYNDNPISSYYDGGQFGLVQLQNEYYVMADVVDFINSNDITLYMIDATSPQIDWAYDGYAPDDRWIGGIKDRENNPHSIGLIKDGNFDNTIFANSLPFVVSYSDSVSDVEAGNILYTAKAGVSNELLGAKYLMCFRVIENGTTKYVPLVNRKQFKDPVTQNSYTFSSDYLSSNYRGVIVAKGVFAQKQLFGSAKGNVNGMNGSPTYIRSGASMSADNGGGTISSNVPYYYYMDVSGQMIQYAGYDTNGSTDQTIDSKYIDKYSAYLDGFTIDDSLDTIAYDALLRTDFQDNAFSTISASTYNRDYEGVVIEGTESYLEKMFGNLTRSFSMQQENIKFFDSDFQNQISCTADFPQNMFKLNESLGAETSLEEALKNIGILVSDSDVDENTYRLSYVYTANENNSLTFATVIDGRSFFIDVLINTEENTFSFRDVESNDLVLKQRVGIVARKDQPTNKDGLYRVNSEYVSDGFTTYFTPITETTFMDGWHFKIHRFSEEGELYFQNNEYGANFVGNFNENSETQYGTFFLDAITLKSQVISVGESDASGKKITFNQIRYADPANDDYTITKVAEKQENISTANDLNIWFNINGDINNASYYAYVVNNKLCFNYNDYEYYFNLNVSGNTLTLDKAITDTKIETFDGKDATGGLINTEEEDEQEASTFILRRKLFGQDEYQIVQLDYDLMKKITASIKYINFQNTEEHPEGESATAIPSGIGTNTRLEFVFDIKDTLRVSVPDDEGKSNISLDKGYFCVGFEPSTDVFFLLSYDSKNGNYDAVTYYRDPISCLAISYPTANTPGSKLLPKDGRNGADAQPFLELTNLTLDSSVYASTYQVTKIRNQANLFEITNNGLSQTITSDFIQNLILSLYYDNGVAGRIGCSATYEGQNVSSDGISKALFSFYYSGATYYLVVQYTSETISVCSYTADGDRFIADTNNNRVVAQTKLYTLYYDYTSKTDPSEIGVQLASLSPSDFVSTGSKDGYTLFSTVEKQTVKDGKFQFVNSYFDTNGTGRLVTLTSEGNLMFAEPVKKTQENITDYFYHSDEYTFQLYNYYTGYTGTGTTTLTKVTPSGDREQAPLEDFPINNVSMSYYWCGSCRQVDNNQFKWQFFNRLLFGAEIKDLRLDDITIKLDGIEAKYTGVSLRNYQELDDQGKVKATYDLRMYSITKNNNNYYFIVKANYEDATIEICDAEGKPYTAGTVGKMLKEPKYTVQIYEGTGSIPTGDEEIDGEHFNPTTTVPFEVKASNFNYYKTTGGANLFETVKDGDVTGDQANKGIYKTNSNLKESSLKLQSNNTTIKNIINIDIVNSNGGFTLQAIGYGIYKSFLSTWTEKEMLINPGLSAYDINTNTVTEAKALSNDDSFLAWLGLEASWTFTVLVDSDFSWSSQSNSYGLYNGKNYVATIYKNVGQVINGPEDISSKSIRILYDNNTYYNLASTNKFDDPTAMLSHYEQMRDSMVTSFYRTNNYVKPIDMTFKILPLINLRIHVAVGPSDMVRGGDRMGVESPNAFKLSNGINFDYFFDSPDVKLTTFYAAAKISYWILVISAVLIIKTLMTALWGIVKRFYEITLYFIAMPAVAATIPLDSGTKFKDSIQGPLIKKVLSTYGVILGINVFFVLLSPVKTLSQVFTEEDIATSGTYFLKYLPIPASWLNDYVYILFVLVAFTMIETLPGVISNIIGSEDALAKGKETKSQVGENLSSAGDIVSGRSAMKAVGGAVKNAANFIPGSELVAAPIRGVSKAIDRGIENFGRGFGEGYGSKTKDENDNKDENGDDSEEGGSSRIQSSDSSGGSGDNNDGSVSGQSEKRQAIGKVSQQNGKLIDQEGNEVDANGFIIANEQAAKFDEGKVRAIVLEELAKIPHETGEAEQKTGEGDANPANENAEAPAEVMTPIDIKRQELEQDIANREFIDENISIDRVADVAANGGNFSNEEWEGLTKVREQMGLSAFEITSPQDIAKEVIEKYDRGRQTADELSQMAVDEEQSLITGNKEFIDRGVDNEQDMKIISDNVSIDKLTAVAAGTGTFTDEDKRGISVASERLQLDFSSMDEEEIAKTLLEEYGTYKNAAEFDRQKISEGEQKYNANQVLQRQISGQKQRFALGITDAEIKAAIADPTKTPELEEDEDEEHDENGNALTVQQQKEAHQRNEERHQRNEQKLVRDAQVKQVALRMIGTDDVIPYMTNFKDENEVGISDEERANRKAENVKISKQNEEVINRHNKALEMQQKLGLSDEEITAAHDPSNGPELESEDFDENGNLLTAEEKQEAQRRNQEATLRWEQAKQVSMMLHQDTKSDDFEEFVDEEHDEDGNELTDEEKAERHKTNLSIAARNADKLANPEDYKDEDEDEEGISKDEKKRRHKANEERHNKIRERLGVYAGDGEEVEHKKTFKEKFKEGSKNFASATGKRLLLGVQDLGSRAKEFGGSMLKLVGLDNVFSTRNKDGSKRSLLNMIALSPFRVATGLIKAVPNLPRNLVNVAAKTGKLAMGLDLLHLTTGYTKATKQRYKAFKGEVPRSLTVMGLKATGKGAVFVGKQIGRGASFLGKMALNTKAGKATVNFGRKIGRGTSYLAKSAVRYTRVAGDALKFLTLPAENYAEEARKHKEKLVKDIDKARYRARIRKNPKKQEANRAKQAENAKTADKLRNQALALLAAHNINIDPNAAISKIQAQAGRIKNNADREALQDIVVKMNKTDRERIQLEQEAQQLESLLERSKEVAKQFGDENYVPRRARKAKNLQAIVQASGLDNSVAVAGVTAYEVGKAEVVGNVGGLDGTAPSNVEVDLAKMGYNNGAVSDNATAISNSVRNLIKANLSGARTGEVGRAATQAAKVALKLHTATATGGADSTKVEELLNRVSSADKIDAIRRTLTPSELVKFNEQFKRNGADLTGKALERKYKEVLAKYEIIGSASKNGAFSLSVGVKGSKSLRTLGSNDKLYSQLVMNGNVSDENITTAVQNVGATERIKDFAGEHLAMSVDLSTSGAVAESVLVSARKDEIIAGEAVRKLLESSDKGKDILSHLEREQGKLDAVSLSQLASSDVGLASFMNEHKNEYNNELLASAQRASMDGTFKLQAWDLLSSNEKLTEIEQTRANIEALAKSSILTGATKAETDEILANIGRNLVVTDKNSTVSRTILDKISKLTGNTDHNNIRNRLNSGADTDVLLKVIKDDEALLKKVERLGTNDTRLALSRLKLNAKNVMSNATDEMKSLLNKLFAEYARENSLKDANGKELTFEGADRIQINDFISKNKQAANIICGIAANKNYGQALPKTETEKQVESELSAKVMDTRALLNTFLNKTTHTGEEKDIMDGLIQKLGSDILIKGELKTKVDAYNNASHTSWEDGAKLLATLGVRPDLLKNFEESLTIGQRNELVALGSKDSALALSVEDKKKLKSLGVNEHVSYYQAMLALGRQGKMNKTIAEEAEKKKAVDLAYDLEGESIRSEDIRQFLSETANNDPATIKTIVDRYIEGMGLSDSDAAKQKDLMSMGLGQINNFVASMVYKKYPDIARATARDYERTNKGSSFADLDISRQNEEIKKFYLASRETTPDYLKDSVNRDMVDFIKQTDIEKLYITSLMESGVLKKQLDADFVSEDGKRIAKTTSSGGLANAISIAAKQKGVSVDEYIASHRDVFMTNPNIPADKNRAILAGISEDTFEGLIKKISRDRTDPANDALVAAKKLLIEQNYYKRKENGINTPSDLPDLAGMSPEERREYNYRLSVINTQIRLSKDNNSESDILKNILQNTSFANERYMLREMARKQGIKKAENMDSAEIKSLLTSATVNDYFTTNKAFEAMMVQAGANNIYTALSKESRDEKKLQAVENNASLLADVLKELAKLGKFKRQKGEDERSFLDRVKTEYIDSKTGKFKTDYFDLVMKAIRKLESNTKTGAKSEFDKVLYNQITQVVSYQANSTPRQQAKFFNNDSTVAIKTVHEAMDSKTSALIHPKFVRPIATGGSQIVGDPKKQIIDDAKRAVKELELQEFARLKAEISRLSTNKLKSAEFAAEARKLLGKYYDTIYSSKDKYKEMLEGNLGTKSSSIQKNEIMKNLDALFEKAARQADSLARLVPAKKLFYGDERFRGVITGHLKLKNGGADTSKVKSLVSKVTEQNNQLETTNIKELMAQNADYKAVVESYMAKLARSKELQDAISKSESRLEELRSNKNQNKSQIKLEEENLKALITRLGLTQPVLEEIEKRKRAIEHEYAAKNEARRINYVGGSALPRINDNMARGLFDPKGAPFDPRRLSERDRREFAKAYRELAGKLQDTINRSTYFAEKARRIDRDLRSRLMRLDNNLSKVDLLTKSLSAENRKLIAELKKMNNSQSADARKIKNQIEENIGNIKRVKQDVDTFSKQVQRYAKIKPAKSTNK